MLISNLPRNGDTTVLYLVYRVQYLVWMDFIVWIANSLVNSTSSTSYIDVKALIFGGHVVRLSVSPCY